MLQISRQMRSRDQCDRLSLQFVLLTQAYTIILYQPLLLTSSICGSSLTFSSNMPSIIFGFLVTYNNLLSPILTPYTIEQMSYGNEAVDTLGKACLQIQRCVGLTAEAQFQQVWYVRFQYCCIIIKGLCKGAQSNCSMAFEVVTHRCRQHLGYEVHKRL